MSLGGALVAAALVLAGGAAIFQSCGRFGATRADRTASLPAAAALTATSPSDDATQAFTLDVGFGSVNAPAGTLAAGDAMTATAGTAAPAAFAAANGAPAASQPLAVAAVDAAGAPVPKANQPLTIALAVQSGATLADTDKAPGNLCAFGAGIDKQLRIWRAAALRYDQATATVTFPSIWLGSFQLYYCGAATIAGALDVNPAGTDTAVKPNGPSFATCDLTQVAGNGQCWSYTGTNYGQLGALATAQARCAAEKGSFGGGNCPEAGEIGVCAFHFGTTAEMAWTFYQSDDTGTTTTALKASCARASGQLFGAGAYVATPAGQQTPFSL